MARRPARLRKLRITRVDRVDSGANSGAHVALYKAAVRKETADERREQLQALVQQRYPAPDDYVWVADYELDDNWFVYSRKSELFKIGYAEDASGTLQLVGDEIPVRRRTLYVPLEKARDSRGRFSSGGGGGGGGKGGGSKGGGKGGSKPKGKKKPPKASAAMRERSVGWRAALGSRRAQYEQTLMKEDQMAGKDDFDLDPEVAEYIDNLEAQLAAATAPPAAAATEPADLTEEQLVEAAAKHGKELVAKKAPEPSVDDLPEPIRKRLEDAESQNRELAERVAKAEEERRLERFAKKVREDFAAIGAPDTLGPVLAAIEKVAPDELKQLETFLKSANAAVSEAEDVLGKERGTALPGGDPTAAGEIDSLAKAKRAANPELTDSQARAAVVSERPDLYERSRKA